MRRTWPRAVVAHRKRVTGGELTPQGAVAEAAESAALRFAGVVAVALPAALLVQAVIEYASYRQPAVAVVVWLGVLAVAAWLMPRARSGHLGIGHALVALAVAAAAVTAIGLDRPVHAGRVDWTILGTVWLLALLTLTTRAWLWVPGSMLVLGIHAAFVIAGLGFSALGLTRLAASSYAVVSIVVVFAALRPAMRAHAEMAVRRAGLASRSAAERAAVTAIGEVRRGRLGLLEMEALPLLRGIADGTLDPSDGAVRRRCAEHAATLRLALMDRSLPDHGLLAALEPVLAAARERGAPVEVQVIGDPGDPGAEVARTTVAAAGRVLRALPAQPVLLTVLASGDETEMYLTFDRPPAGEVAGLAREVAGLGEGGPAGAAWRAELEAGDAGPGCLEIRWRTGVPP